MSAPMSQVKVALEVLALEVMQCTFLWFNKERHRLIQVPEEVTRLYPDGEMVVL